MQQIITPRFPLCFTIGILICESQPGKQKSLWTWNRCQTGIRWQPRDQQLQQVGDSPMLEVQKVEVVSTEPNRRREARTRKGLSRGSWCDKGCPATANDAARVRGEIFGFSLLPCSNLLWGPPSMTIAKSPLSRKYSLQVSALLWYRAEQEKGKK